MNRREEIKNAIITECKKKKINIIDVNKSKTRLPEVYIDGNKVPDKIVLNIILEMLGK